MRSAAAFAAALWAAAFATGVSAQDAQTTIRIASPYKTTTLDPIRSAAAGNIEPFGQLYARLLRRDDEGNLEPGLAESWEQAPDNLSYTFHLRDAQFSNGTPITAEDVAFSLNRGRTHEESAYPAPFASIESVEAVDEDSVRVNLKAPSAPLLSYMEIFNAGIVSKEDVETRGEETAFTEDPVTSGPFKVAEWRPNDRLILERNPNYWREGYPKVDRAELIEVSDANTRVSMLQAGEIDAVRDVPWAQVEELEADPKIEVPLEPSTVINVVLLNHAKPPFDTLEARRAAALALDRPALADAITLGKADPANTTLPNALLYHAGDIEGPAYDPEEARSLLENVEDRDVVIMISPGNEQAASLIQAQWMAAGFRPTIERVDRGLWWERLEAGDYDAAPSWWYNETEDPDLAVRWALCGTCGTKSYHTNYSNERINALTDQALAELDETKRAQMYREIQEISTEEVSQIPLYYPPFANAYSTRIEGLRLSPALQWSLEETEIAE
jgi:peptide/nickel transport system substrate-binding protein